MTNEQKKVLEFMRTFQPGQVKETPSFPATMYVRSLRYQLIEEELREFDQAMADRDLVKVADAIGDLLYVVYGAAVAFGIDMQPVFDEIHKSNMSKVGGHTDLTGKWIKPATYKPAELGPIIENQIKYPALPPEIQ